jgi:hypothetical protein
MANKDLNENLNRVQVNITSLLQIADVKKNRLKIKKEAFQLPFFYCINFKQTDSSGLFSVNCFNQIINSSTS